MTLVTPQTGPEGQLVRRVLVEEQTQIERELYLAVLIDSATGCAGAHGLLGRRHGDRGGRGHHTRSRSTASPSTRRSASSPTRAARSPSRSASSGDLLRPAVALMSNLYRFFVENDCSLAEINPLVVTKDGRILALDAKVNFDDNALFRHADIVALRDKDEEDPLEVRAQDEGISNYVKLDGNIGCVVNGAGLAMATMDAIKLAGGEPANFLDIATANDPQRVVNALGIIGSDPEREGDPDQHLRRHGPRRRHRRGHHRGATSRTPSRCRSSRAWPARTSRKACRCSTESPVHVERAEDLGEAARKAVARCEVAPSRKRIR